MTPEVDYKAINKASWNARTDYHFKSEFYDIESFIAGKSSLKNIELPYLKDIKGKTVLHLQCHFGMDSLSLARLGAEVTGVDISDRAITRAKELAAMAGVAAEFVCCDIYDLPNHLDKKFDVVFTSYGTIGWLPDLDKWAEVVALYLKPGGQLIFTEFHPFVWMYDDDFEGINYNYFNTGAIVEIENGTYADRTAPITRQYVMWNHSLSEVLNSLIKNGMGISKVEEFNYSLLTTALRARWKKNPASIM